ncbi:MAG TPA: o-succinylbenzoate synthase, partial [Gemmatimonadaceae bacterium]
MTGATKLHVDRIVLREVRLALREPFRISSGLVTDRRIAILQLFDVSGASTWSECVAFQDPNYTSE